MQYKKTQKETEVAGSLLAGTGISLLDAARLIRNALDFKPEGLAAPNLQYCAKIIQHGVQCQHLKDMSIADGFELYLKTKTHLRPDSLRDIKYLGRRLLKHRPDFAAKHFAALSVQECNEWLSTCFTTASQFNKGHAMLHALFNYALRQEWIERNVVKLVAKEHIIEREITPLSVDAIRTLLKLAKTQRFEHCAAGVALLIWAGIRPSELKRLSWGDIDWDERVIIINATTSKTGGTRHVEICSTLLQWLRQQQRRIEKTLLNPDSLNTSPICPPNWQSSWRDLRKQADLSPAWVQDVLRHSYATYHMKLHQDLSRLQINMGHSTQNLLLRRYINMKKISTTTAKIYFKSA